MGSYLSYHRGLLQKESLPHLDFSQPQLQDPDIPLYQKLDPERLLDSLQVLDAVIPLVQDPCAQSVTFLS